MIEGISIQHILVLTSAMFFIGVYGFLTRKNLITILMSTELILNAACINFVAFNKYFFPDEMQGHFFTIFIIAVAAAEAALAIAIIVNLFRNFRSVNVEEVDKMKH